jgi:hypothetical protein
MDRLKFKKMNYMCEKIPIYLVDDDGAQKKIFIYFLFSIEYRKYRTIKRDANG